MANFLLSAMAIFAVALTSVQVEGLSFKFNPYSTPNQCLTVTNQNLGDGLVYSVLPCDGSAWQSFEQQWGPNPTVFQISPWTTSGSCNPQCVDVVSGSGPQPVIQNPCNRTDRSQMWVQAPAPVTLTGASWLKNLENGLCMTAESGGGYVDTYACTSGALHQNWKIQSGNQFVISNELLAVTNPCLTTKYANPNAGATYTSEACATQAAYNQVYAPWASIVALYKNGGSGKCIDGGGSYGQPYQYTCSPNSLNHNWALIQYDSELAAGIYCKYVFDVLSGLCLTSDPANPTNLQMKQCVKGTATQQWIVNP